MVESFITIQIEGVQEDGGEVRLNEFIEELTAVKNALRQTERLVLRSDASVIDYRVVKLSRNSPCSVTLGMTARDPVYKDAPQKLRAALQPHSEWCAKHIDSLLCWINEHLKYFKQ